MDVLAHAGWIFLHGPCLGKTPTGNAKGISQGLHVSQAFTHSHLNTFAGGVAYVTTLSTSDPGNSTATFFQSKFNNKIDGLLVVCVKIVFGIDDYHVLRNVLASIFLTYFLQK